MDRGHSLEAKARTSDIKSGEDLTFNDLLLSPKVLSGLDKAGFIHPSPIQIKAIPLGRCGMDLIVQAKSGTGKTCVFTVIALESVAVEFNTVQVLVLSPTREIAVQSQNVICTLGSCMSNLQCHTFIGGIHLSEDLKLLKSCHIAVGSPGRIKYLIEAGHMKTDAIRLFVLDEADMLFTENFQPTINWIYSSLPNNKQVITLSATYTSTMIQHLTMYMKNPTFVRLNASDPALLGIKQFFCTVPNDASSLVVFQTKAAILFKILSSVEFQQCLVFSNYHSSAQDLCETLTENGWPAAYIASSLDQAQRLEAYDKLKRFHCRVLVSTDLTSRGIDAENVNLIINMEVPWEHETYLHRIGRAGRYGSHGAAVTLVSQGDELKLLLKIQEKARTKIHQLPAIEDLPVDIARSECQLNLNDLVTTEQLVAPRSGSSWRRKKRGHAPDDMVKPSDLNANILDEEKPVPPSEDLEANLENPTSSVVNGQTEMRSIVSPTYLPPPRKQSNFAFSSINEAEVSDLLTKMWTPKQPVLHSDHNVEVSDLLSRFQSGGIRAITADLDSLSSAKSTTLCLTEANRLSELCTNFVQSRHSNGQPSRRSKCSSVSSDTTRSSSATPPPRFVKEIGVQTRELYPTSAAKPPKRKIDFRNRSSNNNLVQLDAEFWRLHQWASFYSSEYERCSHLVNSIEQEIDSIHYSLSHF